jgi:hypothetical protein
VIERSGSHVTYEIGNPPSALLSRLLAGYAA